MSEIRIQTQIFLNIILIGIHNVRFKYGSKLLSIYCVSYNFTILKKFFCVISSLLANVSTNLYIHDLSYKHNVDEPVARS